MRELLPYAAMFTLALLSSACESVSYPTVTPVVPRRYPTPAGAAIPSARPVIPLAPVFVGKPEEGQLANGIRVRVYPDASLPLVSVAFVMTRGASADDTYALRWLFSRGVLGSSAERTRAEARADLSYLGSQLQATPYPDGMVWSFDTIEPLWTTTFRRVASMLSTPKFLPEDLKTDIRDCGAEDSTPDEASAIHYELMRMLYGARHPFVHTDAMSCTALTRDAVVRYRNRTLSPKSLTVVIAGDVSLAQVLVEAEDDFPGFVDHGVTPPSPPPPVPSDLPARLEVVRHDGGRQVQFAFGFAGPSASHPDLPALRVLAQALGGALTGRLNVKVRAERGTTYGVRMWTVSHLSTGHMVIDGALADTEAAASLEALLFELERSRQAPLTARELGLAKKAALTEISRAYEGPPSAMHDVVGLTLGGLSDQGAIALGIDATTSEDVRRVAEKYIVLTHMQVVIAGANASIDPVKRLLKSLR